MHRSPRLSALTLLALMGCTKPQGATTTAPADPVPSPAASLSDDHAAPAAGATSDWWSTVQARLAREAYRPHPLPEGGLGFRNPLHGLEATLQQGRLALASAPDTRLPEGWSLEVRTVAIGRGDAMVPAVPGETTTGPCLSDEVDATGACTPTLQHAVAEGVTAWWANDSDGLEQGWTFTKAPAGEGELQIDVGIEGFEVVMPDHGGSALLTTEGRSFSYRDLMAWDADGRDLPVRMAAIPGGVRLSVDIEGAAFPVTVDPTIGDPTWYVEADVGGSYLGYALDMAGDVNGDGYDDILIAAPYASSIGTTWHGKVYAFHGAADGPSTTADWTLTGSAEWERLGYDVAGAGDVDGDGYDDILVGAIGYSNGRTYEGRVQVFHGSATGLDTTSSWSGESNQDYGYMGQVVAGAGDVDGDGYDDILVGVPSYDIQTTSTLTDAGRARVYLGSSTGVSTTAHWTLNGTSAYDSLGYASGSAGDIDDDGYDDLYVSLPRTDTDEGEVRVFHGSSSGLSSTADWTADGATGSLFFGHQVAAAGDVDGDGYDDLAIRADLDAEGEVQVYLGSSSGLSSSPDWTVSGDEEGTDFGRGLAGAGDVNGDGYDDLAIGVPGDSPTSDSEGTVRVYLGASTGLESDPAWTARSFEFNGRMGYQVAGGGDVDGDGYDDLLVSAPWFGSIASNTGRVYLYRGSSDGLEETEVGTVEGSEETDGFGFSVAGAGDVNGDGYDDVVVGAPGYDDMGLDEGRAYLFEGAATGLSTTAAWTYEGGEAGMLIGHQVSGAGDVNGDGYDDIAIGSRAWEDGEAEEGIVLVFHGDATGLPASADWSYEPDTEGAALANDIAAAGDVNDDGYDDLIVSAHGMGTGGQALVFHGASTGLSSSPDTTLEEGTTGAGFGFAVAGIGDVNDDGIDDVAVGAPNHTDGIDMQGAVFVYHGSTSGLTNTADWDLLGDSEGAALGATVDGAGDVDGDGVDDLIVGAPYQGTNVFDGSVSVFGGSTTGLDTTAMWTRTGGAYLTTYGRNVAGIGDVNDDGYDDILVRSDTYDQKVEIFLGSATGPESDVHWASDPILWGAGSAVAGAGDVNGDGFADIALGGMNSVWMFYGNAIDLLDGPNEAPIPGDDLLTTTEALVLFGDLFANDTDPEEHTFDVTAVDGQTAAVGVATVLASQAIVTVSTDGTVTYDPDARFEHLAAGETTTDAFTYEITDVHGDAATASVTVIITGENDAPILQDDAEGVVVSGSKVIDVLANDGDVDDGLDASSVTITADPANGTATVDAVTGQITYTHTSGGQTSDTLTYQACDLFGACDTATLTLSMHELNTPPDASDDWFTVDEGGSVALVVAANDIDPLGAMDLSTVTITAAPTRGTTTIDPLTGVVTYQHDGSESTSDGLDYRICNAQAQCDSAHVSVSITPVNDDPVAVPDNARVLPGESVSIPVLDNDTDPENLLDVYTLAVTVAPEHGFTEISTADGAITYIHDGGDAVDDGFRYQICDAQGACAEAAVTVAIGEPEDTADTSDSAETGRDDTGTGSPGDDDQLVPGCGCNSTGGSAGWLGLGVGLLAVGRRRRR